MLWLILFINLAARSWKECSERIFSGCPYGDTTTRVSGPWLVAGISVYLSSALSAAALAEEAARWVLSTLCALHAAQPPPVPLGGWVECLECETRPRGTRGTRWRALARFDPAAAAARLWG